MKAAVCLLGAAAILGLPSRAASLPIGVLAFDVTSPGPNGITTFNLTNLTGSYSLPPAFPVMTDVTMQNVRLQLESATGPLAFDLGDVGPGPFGDPLALLSFADTIVFTRARLTATVAGALLDLADGSRIRVSSLVAATLLPSRGSSLEAGTDFVLIEAAPAAVPEPATLILLGGGLVWRERRRRSARDGRRSSEPSRRGPPGAGSVGRPDHIQPGNRAEYSSQPLGPVQC